MNQVTPCGDNWHQESGSFASVTVRPYMSEPDNAAKRETYVSGVSSDWNWNPSYQWTQPFQYFESKEERLARRFYSEHLERGGKPSDKAARRYWKAARSFYEAEEL